MSSSDRFYLGLLAIIFGTGLIVALAGILSTPSSLENRAQKACIDKGGVPVMWVQSHSMSDCKFREAE